MNEKLNECMVITKEWLIERKTKPNKSGNLLSFYLVYIIARDTFFNKKYDCFTVHS